MQIHDWHTAESDDLEDAFATEILRWHDVLGWDASESWAVVDDARRRGVLPGFVAVDASGAVVGWTFYLRHGQELQIGALNATTACVTQGLLDAIFASQLAADISSAVFFSFSTAPDLERLLASRGFEVERYLYLERSTSTSEPALEGASWDESKTGEMATLLASAYDNTRARPFAREGTFDDWRHYVAQIIATFGCGTFLSECCQLLAGDDEYLDAAVLTTQLSTHTMHLAQVAVDPQARGRGLAAALVTAALGAGQRAGFSRATLLVGERNAPARRIYDRLGFRETAAFVSATLN